jgi:hypothetical protein
VIDTVAADVLGDYLCLEYRPCVSDAPDRTRLTNKLGTHEKLLDKHEARDQRRRLFLQRRDGPRRRGYT